MMRKLALLAVAATLASVAGGCSRTAYINKVNEAENLSRKMEELQRRDRELSSENEALKIRIANLINIASAATKDRDAKEAELNAAKEQQEKTNATNRELEKTLNTKSETLSMTVSELARRIAEKETENKQLRLQLRQKEEDQSEKIANIRKTYEGWMDQMKQEIGKGQVQVDVPESNDQLNINLVESILFDLGESDLRPEGGSLLKKVIPLLKDPRNKAIRIHGHTDNLPISGATSKRYPTNWHLSAARAISVARYITDMGVDPAKISVVANGEYKPIGDNSTSRGRAKNRRIEIILIQ